MRTKEEIRKALDVCESIGLIIEDRFNHVQLYPDTPNVFGYECKECKEKVGKIEQLQHLQQQHNLPYFVTGKEALEWALKQ